MKATPADQQELLRLQALDTRLQQLAHRLGSLPQAYRTIHGMLARAVAALGAAPVLAAAPGRATDRSAARPPSGACRSRFDRRLTSRCRGPSR